MAEKSCCCCDGVGDLIKIAKIATIVEIIINGVMLATGILFAGFDGTVLFVIVMVCFIIAYLLELVGLYSKRLAILYLNVIIRWLMVITLIVNFIVFFNVLNAASVEFFSIQ